jgi:hypothetical protein
MRVARVGDQVAVVCVDGAGDLYDAGQQPLDAGAHVHWRAAQQQAIDADRLSRPELGSRSPSCRGLRR